MDVHLRRYRLPEGAGWRELLDDARRMSLTDFDHNRPLWEAALVEGLPGGQAAFLLKLHHSIADGQATVMMGLSLFEFGPEPDPNEAPAPPAPDAEDVGVRDVTYANLADTLRRGTDLAVATVRGALDLAKGTVTETRSTWEQAWHTMTSIGRVASVPDGPLSPVMIGRGTTYRFAAFELPFDGHPERVQGDRPERQRRLHGVDRHGHGRATTAGTASSPSSCGSTCRSACGATPATAPPRRRTP